MIYAHAVQVKNIRSVADNKVMKFFKLSLEKSFGAVIYRKNSAGEIKFLLLQYRSGHWEFPRGHKEGIESDEETIRREIKEETGLIDIDLVPNFLATSWFWYTAKGDEMRERLRNKKGTFIFKKIYMSLAKTQTEKIELFSPKEQCGFAWLSFEDALGKITYPQPRKILQKAHDFLEKSP